MKKAVILGERQAGLIEVPAPQPFKDWVVVKVEASALCTEYKSYLVGHELQLGGHEGAGKVVASTVGVNPRRPAELAHLRGTCRSTRRSRRVVMRPARTPFAA